MTQPTHLKRQQYQRLTEIFDTARQRYLDAGGDPTRSSGSLYGDEFLSDEEKAEIRSLGKQLFTQAESDSNIDR